MFTEEDITAAMKWAMKMGRLAVVAEYENALRSHPEDMIPAYVEGVKHTRKFIEEVKRNDIHSV